LSGIAKIKKMLGAMPDPNDPHPTPKPFTEETVVGDYDRKGAWRRGNEEDVRAAMRDSHTPHPASKSFPAETVVGNYEIKGELGRGGMGVVYRARQITLNRVVGLKMLTGHYGPDELTRFLAEAETAAGLHHTNIIQIYEVGEMEGAPFFSMEYVESGSLADRLRAGPIEERQAAQLLISVARALHFAHRNGVVHRDMKPANILLDPEGVPKVADFGIAKRLTANSALTLSGAVIGTPTYMAPEQAKGTSRDVGAAADVYSLGAILYEMLSGRPPFLPEDSETALTVRVITEDAVSPAFYRPGIPRDLETICMKCLEKEPRDRYESAAAFAEDLRRYLDDESILARPPTTVVRTIKWIRRHPWRFVSRAALVAAVIAGAVWLYDWEFYQRAHIEYAGAVEFVNGGLDSLTRLTKEETSHRPVSLRLTRRGRRGPISLVEVLNPHGHPALLRPIQLPEAIPIYIEGVTGVQPNAEKAAESSSVEFIYDGQRAREATARDRNGSVLWRVLYDRASSAEAASAHYVNVRGFDAAHATGASHMEFERDPAGRDVKVSFFNGAGQATPNGEGVYVYKMERNRAGRLMRLTNLDAQGKPMANRAGVIAYAVSWDSAGRLIRREMQDGDGKPATVNGIAAVTTDYDSAGNPSRVRFLGPDGQLARNYNDWVVQEIARDQLGEIAARKYLRLGADDKLIMAGEGTVSYDGSGYPSEIKFTGQQNLRHALQHDERGNLMEEKMLDDEGHPVVNDKGYAIKRLSYKFGPEGMYWEENYFDATGANTYCSAGYHRMTNQFDSTGVLRRQTFEDLDQTRFHYHRDVSEPQYDAQGRQRRNVFRRENEQGQLALDAGLKYAQLEESYDENGRIFLTWEIGCAASAGAPAFSTDLEWHKTGARKRRVRQACDANRKPLALTTTGVASHIEEEFDQLDRRERIYETGFNEKTAGFSTREAKFSAGTFQSVTHKRSDGSVVESIGVFIVEVAAQQARAVELKPGDRLLESNGVPVRSAYEWASANFPGGWIEVLRDGKKLRIEGFEAGSLGVALEDRAVTANP
jgi:YD repeat-containing protein